MRVTTSDRLNEVHRGGQELFLDLIFVGVAFRVGQCMKSCFYDCTPPGGYYGRQLGSE